MTHISHSDFLLEQLKKQRERGFLCDCTVVIGQARYAAHHNVLAAFSEYFSTQCIDAGREDATITLDPEWVNATVFEKLLDYMYTGSLMMDGDEVSNIEKAASYLGIQEVVTRCALPERDVKDSPADLARDTYYTDPRSPLSPDDYDPLEPIEEVEARERLREEGEKQSMLQEEAVFNEESQSSSEQTPQSIEKRSRKPKTRLYEEVAERKSPISPRGRGRGRGRPRGRPRTRHLTPDKTVVLSTEKSLFAEGTGAGRRSGRPRGRPRTRPLSSEAAESTSAEDSITVTNDKETEVTRPKRGRPQTRPVSAGPSESAAPDGQVEDVNTKEVKTLEEVESQAKSELENAKEVVVPKRGRGRPRTRPLPPEVPGVAGPEEAAVSTPIKEPEGVVRKRGRPRVKPLPSEALPKTLNPDSGMERENAEQEEGLDQGKGGSKMPSSDAPNEGTGAGDDFSQGDEVPGEAAPEAGPTKKLRVSTRKRSLSRKLRESQASKEENEDEAEEDGAGADEWGVEEEEDDDDEEEEEEEDDVKLLHNKLRPICNICGNLFSEMSSLRRHMRIHKGIKPYQCQLCGRCFRQGNQLKTHMRIHTGEKPFACSRCDARFAQKCQLVYHCRMHHGEEKPHKCDACPAAFATSSNLKIHMRTHSGEKPYECGECGKRFTQASTLMYHKRRHTGEKPYICDTCGMSFAVSSSLIAHSRKHTGVTPYICLDCGKPCLTSGELRKHMDIHNGSRRVTCNICGNTLSDIYSLKKHRALKHNAPPEQDSDPPKNESIQCPINIPIDHQGLIARVRSVLADSPEPSFPAESTLPSETSVIIHQPEVPMIIQHSEASGSPMIIQHSEASDTPMIIQHEEPAGTQMISGSPMIIQHAESSEASVIIQHAESSETPMIIQHGEAAGSPMIIQHEESSDTPMLIQHGDSSEQVSYVVEQYEIPASSEMEHAQIVIVQTID